MNKKNITQSTKVALVAGTLAVALTGCCLAGSKNCCGKTECCGKTTCCCKDSSCKETPCDGRKAHGMNTSMTVGVGTDGIMLGSDSNMGSRNASMHMNAGGDANGMNAGIQGGVR